MICFPNAKINLGLNITEKRPDGYHNLETVFYPVPVEDALEVTPLLRQPGGECHLQQYGKAIEGNAADNLVAKAYRLLDEEFHLPSVDVHLYKHLPSGAGLGGGSADAAFMLRLLNDQFGLGLSVAELEERAARLGADCAFFIANRPTFARGIGNLFTPIDLSLAGYRIWLVKLPVFVSTREAFSHITPRRPSTSVADIIRRPIAAWRDSLTNDFEESVFPLHPELGELKQLMYRKGALYAAMSGSGSSVFGLFAPGTSPAPESFTEGTFQYIGTLN